MISRYIILHNYYNFLLKNVCNRECNKEEVTIYMFEECFEECMKLKKNKIKYVK